MLRTLFAAILALAPVVSAQGPVTSVFTYQGELRQSGSPVAAAVDLRFRLYDAPTLGAQVGPQLTATLTPSSGRFTIDLDFGAVFSGQNRWLEIDARLTGGPTFTTLSPRQPLSAAPNASFALTAGTSTSATSATTATSATNASQLNGQSASFYLNASNLTAGTIPGGLLSGAYSNPLTLSNASNSFTGSGAGLTSLSAANISSGTLADARLSSNVALLSTAQTFSAAKTFNDGTLLLRNSAGLFATTIAAPSATTARSVTIPDVSGIFITSGNLSSIVATGTVNSGVWQATPVAPAYGGTGLTTFAAGDLLYASSPSALARLPVGAAGRYLRTSGSAPQWSTIAPADLPIPFTISASSPGSHILAATNTSATGGYGLVGEIFGGSGSGSGVYGLTNRTIGEGVLGFASATAGTAVGIRGRSDSADGIGVRAEALATSGINSGLYATTASGVGRAVYAEATSAATSAYGVYARSVGTAVYGTATGTSSSSIGIYGDSPSLNGYGVFGLNTGAGATAILGFSNSSSGTSTGVLGRADSIDGRGVVGEARAASGITLGVYGKSQSPDGVGVYGEAPTGPSGYGVYGFGSLYGVYGRSPTTTGLAYGVAGSGSSPAGAGVYGWNFSGGYGVRGQASSGNAIYAESTGNDALVARTFTTGKSSVFGYTDTAGANGGYFNSAASTGTGKGVVGQCGSAAGYGVYSVGATAATGTKSFQIDHPLDPDNKFLNHYSAEGPEPLNIYSGTATLDDAGRATVRLPDYFDAINRDPRYQLTCIGAFAPVYIAAKARDNRFTIAGGTPGLEISWEVKAIRNDAFVRAHGAPDQIDKPADQRGRYLHPELLDRPPSTAIHAAQR